jgi:hypothetical protein
MTPQQEHELGAQHKQLASKLRQAIAAAIDADAEVQSATAELAASKAAAEPAGLSAHLEHEERVFKAQQAVDKARHAGEPPPNASTGRSSARRSSSESARLPRTRSGASLAASTSS